MVAVIHVLNYFVICASHVGLGMLSVVILFSFHL